MSACKFVAISISGKVNAVDLSKDGESSKEDKIDCGITIEVQRFSVIRIVNILPIAWDYYLWKNLNNFFV